MGKLSDYLPSADIAVNGSGPRTLPPCELRRNYTLRNVPKTAEGCRRNAIGAMLGDAQKVHAKRYGSLEQGWKGSYVQ